MIRFKLDALLTARSWSAYRLSQETGIREDKIGGFRNNAIKYASLDQLNKICAALRCAIGELMEYVPDKSPRKASARKKR